MLNHEMPSQPGANATLTKTLGRLLINEDLGSIQLSQRLHKEIAGSMVACTSLSEMIRHELAKGESPAEVGKLHRELDSALRHALGVVRDMTENLFPPVLKVFGLNAALQQLVRGLTENFAGSLVLHINGNEPRLNLASRLNLFRIIHGLLNLCVVDADASWLEITCQIGEKQIEISIDHDGCREIWTDAAVTSEIAIIHARCGMLGSQLDISSTGAHTRVSLQVWIPLSNVPDAAITRPS